MQRFFIGLLAVVLFPILGNAQNVKDKIQWKFAIEKSATANEYFVTATAQLQPGWHVFGQEPGDEFLIPTHFAFENDDCKLLKTEEKGKLKTEDMEGVGTIHYYEKEVNFVATVRSLEKEISGYIEFQVCNATMCLPPTEEKFTLTLQ